MCWETVSTKMPLFVAGQFFFRRRGGEKLSKIEIIFVDHIFHWDCDCDSRSSEYLNTTLKVRGLFHVFVFTSVKKLIECVVDMGRVELF